MVSLVVSHLVPTSNHNQCYERIKAIVVVSHLVPTSNHNLSHIFTILTVRYIKKASQEVAMNVVIRDKFTK